MGQTEEEKTKTESITENVTENKQEKKERIGLGFILKTGFSIITTLALLLSFTAATYAWFSSNSVVNTDRVTGRSGTDSVELQISKTGGNDFQGGKEAALLQVNVSSSELLMPVSTADLKTFVSSPGMVDGQAIFFERIQGEKYIYHGRIYLRAASKGHGENARLALYLDHSKAAGGELFTGMHGLIANAARLGLTFDGGSTVIMRLSEASNPSDQQVMNAVVNGVEVKPGQVINGTADPMQIVADPSVPLAKHMVGENGLAGDASVKPLMLMELNRIYAVDVYFYLEGCDPDCSDVTKLDSLNLHLAFYGVLMEEAN
ncbi:MAG: hypothetical protein IKS85_01125 [Lachnospiraceae bacterium]|nr:hypothetical protein [Lachnospiraceae bacterium]